MLIFLAIQFTTNIFLPSFPCLFLSSIFYLFLSSLSIHLPYTYFYPLYLSIFLILISVLSIYQSFFILLICFSIQFLFFSSLPLKSIVQCVSSLVKLLLFISMLLLPQGSWRQPAHLSLLCVFPSSLRTSQIWQHALFIQEWIGMEKSFSAKNIKSENKVCQIGT